MGDDAAQPAVGGERLEVRLTTRADTQAAVRALSVLSDEAPHCEGDIVTVGVRRRAGMIVEAVRRLDDADVGVDDITLRRPTLDDVFLGLTGRSLREAAVDHPAGTTADATTENATTENTATTTKEVMA